MTRRSSWIRTEAVGPLQRRIARMRRQAERLALSPPMLKILEADRDRTRVELVGEPPRLRGWAVAAELHHTPEGTRVDQIGERLPAGEWESTEPRCDHCGLRRSRKKTLLLVHNSGDVAQVGTGCLEDFTGSGDPLGAIALERDLRAAQVNGREERSEPEPTVVAFLSAVAALAREEGFVSKADSGGDIEASAELAATRIATGKVETGFDVAAGEELERWVLRELAGREDLGGYERRLVSVFRRSERVGPRDRATIASAWPMRRREASREHLGAAGEAVEVEVLVEATSALGQRSRHGEVVRHQMRDTAGHRLVWFAVGRELEAGSRYLLKCRVRRNESFRGEAITVLERCSSEQLP